MKSKSKLSRWKWSLPMALLGIASASPSQAQTWTNAGGNFVWNNTANWTPNTIPNAASASATLGTLLTSSATITFTSGVTLGSLNFSNVNASSAVGYTLAAGQTITFNNGGSAAQINITGGALTAGNQTIATALAFAAATPWSITNNGAIGLNTLTISGTLTGNATPITVDGISDTTISSVIGNTFTTLTKTGTGTLTLTGVNAFTGAVSINGGTISANADAALGGGTAVNLNGGVLAYNSATALTTARNFTLGASGGGIAVTGAGAVTATGTLSGTTQFAKTGSGTLALSGANAGFSGPVAVSGGVLSLSGAGTLGTASVVRVSSATLFVDNSAAAPADNRYSSTAGFTLSGGEFRVSGQTLPGGQVVGTLNANGYNAITMIPGGTETQVFVNTLNRSPGATLLLRDAGNGSTIGSGAPGAGVVNLRFNTAPTVTAGGLVPWINSWDGGDNLWVVGYDPANGAQVITTGYTGGVDFSGTTAATNYNQNNNAVMVSSAVTINSLIQDTWDTTGFAGGTTLTVASGVINISSTAGTRSYTFGCNPGTNLITVDFAGSAGYWSLASGTNYYTQGTGREFVINARLTNFGTSPMVFSGLRGNGFRLGDPTNTMPSIVIQGIAAGPDSRPFFLAFRQDGNLGAAGGTVNLSNAELRYTPQTALSLTVNRPFVLDGGAFLGVGTASGDLTVSGGPDVVGSRGNDAQAGAVLQWDGIVSGTGSLTKNGPGTLILTNTGNNYSGGTFITAGNLAINATGVFGTGPVTLNGGNLQVNFAGNLPSSLTIVGTTGGINTNGNNIVLTGSLAGGGTLNKSGLGTLSFTSASSFAGNFGVTAGGLAFSGAGSALNAGSVTLAGGTFTLDNSAGNVQRLSSSANMSLSAGEFVLQGNSAGTSVQLGALSITGGTNATNTITVKSAGSLPTILQFASLNVAANAGALFRGDGLGGSSGAFSRIRFTVVPTLVNGLIPGSTFSSSSTGTGTGAATYNSASDANGVIGIVVVPTASGNVINNGAPENLPTNVFFTTTGAATVVAPATVGGLILDNTPTVTFTSPGALTIGAGILGSQNTGAGTTISGNAATDSVAFGAAASVNTATNLTINLPVTGAAGLTKVGTGTLTLGGTYGITGALAVSAGTLSTAGNPLSVTVVTVDGTLSTGGGALTVTSLLGGVTGVVNTAAGILTANQTTNSTFAGTISAASISKTGGSGTLSLTAANATSAPILVTGGTPTTAGQGGTIALSGATGSIASTSLTLTNGGNLLLDSSLSATVPSRLPAAANVALNGGFLSLTGNATAGSNTNQAFGNLSINGVGLVTIVAGAGTTNQLRPTTLTRTNTTDTIGLRGATLGNPAATNGSGNLIPGNTAGFTADLIGGGGAAGTNTISIVPYLFGRNSDTTTTPNSFVTYDAVNGFRPLLLGGVEYQNTASFAGTTPTTNFFQTAGNITMNPGLTEVNSYHTDIEDLTGSGSTLKVYSGALMFSTTSGGKNYSLGANYIAGATDLTIDFNGKTGYVYLLSSQNFTTQGGGRHYNLNAAMTNLGADGLVLAGLSGNVFYLNNSGNTQPKLTVQGLSGINIFPQQFRTSYADDGSLGAAGGSVTLVNASLNYAPETANSLTVNRPLFLSAQGGWLAVGAASGAGSTATNSLPRPATPTSVVQWAGVIANRGSEAGRLTIEGPGTLILTAANTYTGGTTITGGTVRVNNTSGSAFGTGPVSIATGATVGGSGTITGAVNVASGGRLEPGNSPGVLTINGAVTLNPGATFAVELNGTTVGTTYDRLVAPGGININGATLSTSIGYVPGAADSLTIISGGTVTGSFAGLPNNTVFSLGSFNSVNYVGTILYTANSVIIQPVPEPATMLGLAAAGFGAVSWIRRRKTRVAG